MVFDPRIRAGIFAGESGGDYDALFGFSNRPGKRFGNVRLTDMTVDQALNFASPSGPYGQWVKGQIGRVATPMGGYQVVGTTLKAAKQGLGLTGNERMTPETQDRIGQWILEKQGTGAWEGYRGPREPAKPSPLADPAIAEFVKNNPQPGGYGPEVENAVFGGGSGTDTMTGGTGYARDTSPFSIPQDVANYAAGSQSGIGRLGAFLEKLGEDAPPPPRAGGGGFGDARGSGGDLQKVLNGPTIADMMMKRRMMGLLG